MPSFVMWLVGFVWASISSGKCCFFNWSNEEIVQQIPEIQFKNHLWQRATRLKFSLVWNTSWLGAIIPSSHWLKSRNTSANSSDRSIRWWVMPVDSRQYELDFCYFAGRRINGICPRFDQWQCSGEQLGISFADVIGQHRYLNVKYLWISNNIYRHPNA